VPDYTSLYQEYWSRADRWESNSFGDAEALADEVIRLGPGNVLDVGCGMGTLVLTLRQRGIDARGLDVARRTVEEANRRAPGCFEVGSILDIPHPDESFDIVLCLDVLEHLDEADVPTALAELHRVSRQAVLATIATRPDRDGIWHLTVRDRPWWRQRLSEAGLQEHAQAGEFTTYEQSEHRRLGIDESGLWLAVVAKSAPG
jgi:2-polyprenyl-3-methyl-5-hydroxy-6-metoxy-1,4-benzoquinol methylase